MENHIRLDFKCPKKVEEFTSSATGFHCSQCDKPVLDFADYSKEEIIHQLNQYAQKPCVIVPASVIQNKTDKPIYTGFWATYRKSTLLLSILLIAGNIKSVWAQTKSKIQDAASKPMSIPLGYQKIELSGTVTDTDSLIVPNAKLYFSFMKDSLAECEADENGNFSCVIESYGGIRDLDIEVTAKRHFSTYLSHVNILKNNLQIQAKLKPIPKPKDTIDLVVWGTRQADYSISYVGGVSIVSLSPRMTTPMFARHFLGLEILPDLLPTYETKYPHRTDFVDKFVYPIQILDENQQPVADAHIDMWFSPTEKRWGKTDKNGMLKMYVQLNASSCRTEITISAEGYKKKRVWDMDLKNNPTQTIILKKKK